MHTFTMVVRNQTHGLWFHSARREPVVYDVHPRALTLTMTSCLRVSVLSAGAVLVARGETVTASAAVPAGDVSRVHRTQPDLGLPPSSL